MHSALARLLAIAACCIAAPSSATPPHPRELVLAGGSLRICSSVARRDCADASAFATSDARGATRYRIDDAAIAAASDPALWRGRDDMRIALRHVLHALARRPELADTGADALIDALRTTCVDARAPRVVPCEDGQPRHDAPWQRLDDAGRGAVLAALEVPVAAGQPRLRERVALDAGATPHGAAVLRAFVAAAARRADGARPRIAVVTASAHDPFDPVDFYLDALSQAGADVQWWPVDAAMEAAIDAGPAGCARLPALRVEHLGLPRREAVFPDLARVQLDACNDPAAFARLPDRVHGVFFTGGDQWRLRQAFFDDADHPRPWLRVLRDAVARGGVVIGGTSAGSAVQSAAPMLGNGAPGAITRVHAAAPPTPGCARAGTCPPGIDEDAVTVWPAGGLGLAPGLVVDTHFSERARESRLLQVLAATGTRRGIGVDETSAVRIAWQPDASMELDAIGASGAWVFDDVQGCRKGRTRAIAHYLAPGARAWLADGQSRVDVAPTPAPHAARDTRDTRDTAPVRAAASGLARGARVRTARVDGVHWRFARGAGFRAWRASGGPPGLAAMRVEARTPVCAELVGDDTAR